MCSHETMVEDQRQEALRYFEEVDLYRRGGGWFVPQYPGPHHGATRTYRGAFERYLRLGVAAYDGRGR